MSVYVTEDRSRIYKGEVLGFRIDTLRYGRHVPIKREVVEHPGSVVIIPVTSSGTVLLVSQWRHAAGDFLLEAPAGTIDLADKSPVETAQRELREEIGYRATNLEPLSSFWIAPGWCSEYMYAYVATGLTVDPLEQDMDEEITVAEHRLNEIPVLIKSGEIRDSKSIAALLMASQFHKLQETDWSA